MNTEQKKNNTLQIIRCCYGYLISGMAVLMIGAILPSLIQEASLSYTVAGGLLSLMAVGNLSASLIYPLAAARMGRRCSISFFAGLVPVCYFILSTLPAVWVMYLLMFILGISRGSITILNNLVVDEVSGHSTKILNYLHCSFAVGAFLAPFITAFSISSGKGWKMVMYLIIFLCATSTVFYASGSYDTQTSLASGVKTAQASKRASGKKGSVFTFDFFTIAMVLFFYIGLENCVNGWFVTYLQGTGVMSVSFATTMVSVTWLVIMAGRLICAAASKICSKTALILICVSGTSASFLMLISSHTIVPVTAALIGVGFFMSGIYPTSIANAGPLFQGSAVGMSVLTAIASIGGIITPQIVGSAADRVGITAAISILLVNAGMMCLFSFINHMRSHTPMVKENANAR